MGIKIKIRDAQTGNIIEMEVEAEHTIDEIIESVCDYWRKDPNAYVLRCGKNLLSGPSSVSFSGVREGDLLELIPDPEGG